MRASMPVAVIGDAGKLLAQTETVKARTVTSSDEVRGDLEAAGASWEAAPFVSEGTLVTANGAEGVRDAMDAFVALVAQYEGEGAQAA
jgi:protease I